MEQQNSSDARRPGGKSPIGAEHRVYLTGSTLTNRANLEVSIEGKQEVEQVASFHRQQSTMPKSLPTSMVRAMTISQRPPVNNVVPTGAVTAPSNKESNSGSTTNLTSNDKKRSISRATCSSTNVTGERKDAGTLPVPDQRKKQKYERQKERRTALNDAMDELHCVLGISQDTKTDRLFLIGVAIDTVKALREKVKQLTTPTNMQCCSSHELTETKKSSHTLIRNTKKSSNSKVPTHTSTTNAIMHVNQSQVPCVGDVQPQSTSMAQQRNRENAKSTNSNQRGTNDQNSTGNRPRISSMDVLASMIRNPNSPTKSSNVRSSEHLEQHMRTSYPYALYDDTGPLLTYAPLNHPSISMAHQQGPIGTWSSESSTCSSSGTIPSPNQPAIPALPQFRGLDPTNTGAVPRRAQLAAKGCGGIGDNMYSTTNWPVPDNHPVRTRLLRPESTGSSGSGMNPVASTSHEGSMSPIPRSVDVRTWNWPTHDQGTDGFDLKFEAFEEAWQNSD